MTHTDLMMVVAMAVLGGGVAALAILTALGARRRGMGPAAAIISGTFFPLTWAVWYAKDEQPYRRA